MKKKIIKEFFEAWWFLANHPDFQVRGNLRSLSLTLVNKIWVYVTKVNPITNKVSDIDVLNTKVQVWLEWGPQVLIEDIGPKPFWSTSHDIRLDCGGNTYEEAIIELAKLVKKYYGEYKKGD